MLVDILQLIATIWVGSCVWKLNTNVCSIANQFEVFWHMKLQLGKYKNDRQESKG